MALPQVELDARSRFFNDNPDTWEQVTFIIDHFVCSRGRKKRGGGNPVDVLLVVLCVSVFILL